MSVYYPPGVYIGRVAGQELSQSSKGTPQFVLSVDIIDALDRMGASCGVEQINGRTVYLYLSEKSMDMTLKALKALGFNRSSLKFLDPATDGYQDFTGEQVELYCKHEEYEGEAREKWSISTPRETRPLEASELRTLDALFGKALKAQAREAANAEVGGQAADDEPSFEDSCPF